MDTLLQVQFEEPLPPARLRPRLPRDLETICLKCLEKEAARRYRTARDLVDLVQDGNKWIVIWQMFPATACGPAY